MLQPQSKRPGERARAFLTRADVRDALRCLLLALILSFVTEAICRLNPIAAAGYVFTRPLAFLYNTLLIACTLSLALLVKRRRFAYTLISAIWVVLSIVDCCIRLVRITPLNFYDFVIFVSNFSITQSYVTWWQIALIVLAVAALITGMVLLFRRTPRVQPARRPALLLLAALCGLTAVITPIYALNNRDYTDPVAGYNRSGFAYSFCRSVVDRGIRRPETYDENVINGILADVGGDAQPAAATEKLPNFVFLQLESFLDPANITSVTCSENPVPVFTRLKEECSTGLLHVPMIGGGTANVEFEVITGMNLGDFGTGEYPYSTILKSETCETIAYDLRNMGYTAHAIHNHIATFYERNQVYAMLGFDTFTSLEYMTNYTTNSLGWCRDKVLTGCYTPKQTFSFGASLDWKGFDFSFMFQGVAGNYIYNGTKQMGMNGHGGDFGNLIEDVFDTWDFNPSGSKYPRLGLAEDNNGNYTKFSDAFLEKGDYLRLKNITLGYTLPKHIARHIGLTNGSLRVYVSIDNVATITGYSGIDPEVGNYGLDAGIYPSSRFFNFGVNLNF